MSLYRPAAAPNHHGAELNEKFPILCENCLGPSPYVRMSKQELGAQCHICERPFTEFAWCPGRGYRRKRTEICQACAKSKHVCQTCLLDLYYQVPVEARDQILGNVEKMPQSGVNLEYHLQQIQQGQSSQLTNPYADKITPEAHNLLIQMKRSHQPYYQRNLPKICSFWVKGECKRGEECPFRHEKPKDPDDPLNDQNIKDRFFGKKDPVAKKLLEKLGSKKTLQPPQDQSITTLYLSGLPEKLKEQELKDHFYKFGEIRSIRIIHTKALAFIEFVSRQSAESAVIALYNNLVINEKPISVKWSKGLDAEENQIDAHGTDHNANIQAVDNMQIPLPIPGLLFEPSPAMFLQSQFTAPPAKLSKSTNPTLYNKQPLYPSQNPNQFGS